MGVLVFDNTNRRAQATSLVAALSNCPTSAWTCAFLCKRNATGTDFDALGYLKSGAGNGVAELGLSFSDVNRLKADIPAGVPDGTIAALASTVTPYVVVVSRPAGAAQPLSYSYYVRSTTIWTHDGITGTLSNGTAATMLEFGAWQTTGDFHRGWIGLGAWWSSVLSDPQKQELTANWRTSDWYANTGGAPKALVQLNTLTPTDLMSNASTWTYTNLSLDAGETLDSFNFDGTGTVVPVGNRMRRWQY